MKPKTIYLALGTNLGDRANNLHHALEALRLEFTLNLISPCYETEPLYVLDQPRFYNLVCQAVTTLSPLDVLHTIKRLEEELGRESGPRFGPRLIDIDLLFYSDLIFQSPELTLPHPRLHERAFVLVPLADIGPNLIHPKLGLTISELCEQLDNIDQLVRKKEGLDLIHPGSLTIGSTTFEWGTQTYLMGILNITPDSFSGDGLMQENQDWVQATMAQAQAQIAAGVHILDIGGESTRPGAASVSVEEELRRVIPVIRSLADIVNVPISIDTYKAEVARQALAAGATMVNDVWGLQRDPLMARVVAEANAALVVMHNRSQYRDFAQDAQLGGRYVDVTYEDLIQNVLGGLQKSVNLALAAGVRAESIIVDPGIGFGKTVQQNLELIDRLSELKVLNYPLLVGPSRKSFIGYTLNLAPDQRIEGTAASVTLAIDRGADIVRVHDVASMMRVAQLTDAIVRRRSP